MTLKELKRTFKTFDGGSLKFRDQTRRKTYYFEMNYFQFSKIYKTLKNKKKETFYVLSSSGNHKSISLEEIKDMTKGLSTLNVLIKKNNITYGICDRTFMIELLSNMSCPEKEIMNNQNSKPISSSMTISIGSIHTEVKSKRKTIPKTAFSNKKERFDWAEAYEEGLRIFDDDQDEAEAYADEMKYKKTGRI